MILSCVRTFRLRILIRWRGKIRARARFRAKVCSSKHFSAADNEDPCVVFKILIYQRTTASRIVRNAQGFSPYLYHACVREGRIERTAQGFSSFRKPLIFEVASRHNRYSGLARFHVPRKADLDEMLRDSHHSCATHASAKAESDEMLKDSHQKQHLDFETSECQNPSANRNPKT